MRLEISLSHDGVHASRALEMDDLKDGDWTAGVLTPWGTLTAQITPLMVAEPAEAPNPLEEMARAAGLVDESATAALNAHLAQRAEEAGMSAPEPVVLLSRPQFEAPASVPVVPQEAANESPAEPIEAAEAVEPAVAAAESESAVEPAETSTDSGATKPSKR